MDFVTLLHQPDQLGRQIEKTESFLLLIELWLEMILNTTIF